MRTASIEAGLLSDAVYQPLLQVLLRMRHCDGAGLVWVPEVVVATLDPVQLPAIGLQLLDQKARQTSCF